MKLKFEKEVQSIIDAVAALPATTTDETVLRKPMEFISEFDRSLIKRREKKTISVKEWAKLRRQLSFLFLFVKAASNDAEKAVMASTDEMRATFKKQEAYRSLVKVLKDIHRGELLKSPPFIRIALNYGVVYLSDQEIKNLVEQNKRQS